MADPRWRPFENRNGIESLTEKSTPDLMLYDIMTLYQTITDDPPRITFYRPTDILCTFQVLQSEPKFC